MIRILRSFGDIPGSRVKYPRGSWYLQSRRLRWSNTIPITSPSVILNFPSLIQNFLQQCQVSSVASSGGFPQCHWQSARSASGYITAWHSTWEKKKKKKTALGLNQSSLPTQQLGFVLTVSCDDRVKWGGGDLNFFQVQQRKRKKNHNRSWYPRYAPCQC